MDQAQAPSGARICYRRIHRAGGVSKYFGALLVGFHEGKKLKIAGRVGTGFSEKLLSTLFSEGDWRVSGGWKSRTADYRQISAESELRSYSTGAILALHWGTLHRTIRTKDAAIARFGAEQRLTANACVEELAGVSWHRFAFGEAANRTYQHGFQKNLAHTRLSLPGRPYITSWLPARLLLYPQNCVFCGLGDSECDDGLGRNLDFLPRLRIKARARLPFLLHELAKCGQDEFSVLFDRFVGEVAERNEEYANSSFVGLGGSSECDLNFSLGHV